MSEARSMQPGSYHFHFQSKTVHDKEVLFSVSFSIDIMRQNEHAVAESFIETEQAAKEMGLYINEGKTKYMVAAVAPETIRLTTPLQIQHKEEHQLAPISNGYVKLFTDLGSEVKVDDNYDDEIRAWLLAANIS